MCGIVGVLHLDGSPGRRSDVTRMLDSIPHRGPDGVGEYGRWTVLLGHRRLSIIDLSEAGQPADERRRTAAVGSPSTARSTTSASFARSWRRLGHAVRDPTRTARCWCTATRSGGRASSSGSTGCSPSRSGTVAGNRCFLGRDRYGVKPLYWYHGTGAFVFASEIKAILTHPAVPRDLCYPALNEYFSFQNILSDLTLFEGIRLLPPGPSSPSAQAASPLGHLVLGSPVRVRADPAQRG